MIVLAQDNDTGFRAGFDKALEEAALILPKIGYFLLILIVGILVAKLIQKIVTKVLQKVGFDRLVERGGVKQAMSKSKYDAAGILGKIVYYFIFLGVLSLAFSVFGPDNPISRFIDRIVAFLPSLFVAVIALIIAAAVAAAVKDLLSNMLGGLSYGNALANVASIFILGIGVFFALGELGVATLIVGPLFIAILALFVIPPIIAFGVGGIDPARQAIRNLQQKGQEKAREVRQEVSSDADSTEQIEAPAAAARRTRTAATATPARRRRPTA
jgi:hypothetical protein